MHAHTHSQGLLNHCFDDVERFMGRLQQAADARSVLEQRSKKKSRRKSKKNKDGEKQGQKREAKI